MQLSEDRSDTFSLRSHYLAGMGVGGASVASSMWCAGAWPGKSGRLICIIFGTWLVANAGLGAAGCAGKDPAVLEGWSV